MNRPGKAWGLLFSILLVGLVLAAADVLTITLNVVLLIVAGVLFGIFVNGISRWATRVTSLPYLWSYVVVVFLLLALIAGGFYYLGLQIAERADELWAHVNTATQQLSQRLEQYKWAQQYFPEPEKLQDQLAGDSGMGRKLMQGTQWLLWGFTGLLVIFFVGLYVAYDPHLYTTGLIKLVPLDRRTRAEEVLQKLRSTLGYWIIGRLISMTIVGVLTAIGLWVLGVPLPITLAVVAALLTFIPNIGPVLAAIPQALLAWQVGTNTVLYVIVFNIVLQTIESYLITPMVQRYEVSLPPVLTIFGQLLLGVVVGVIGVIMAAPLIATIMLLVQMLYVEDQLGDSNPGRLARNT